MNSRDFFPSWYLSEASNNVVLALTNWEQPIVVGHISHFKVGRRPCEIPHAYLCQVERESKMREGEPPLYCTAGWWEVRQQNDSRLTQSSRRPWRGGHVQVIRFISPQGFIHCWKWYVKRKKQIRNEVWGDIVWKSAPTVTTFTGREVSKMVSNVLKTMKHHWKLLGCFFFYYYFLVLG